MKKCLLIVVTVALVMLFVCGCGAAPVTPPVSTPSDLPDASGTDVSHALTRDESGLLIKDPHPGVSLYVENKILYDANYGDPVTFTSDNRDFLYNLSTDTVVQMYRDTEGFSWSGRMLWMGEGKAYRTTMANGGQVEEFDLYTGKHSVLETLTISSPFSYCDQVSDTVFLYNLVNDKTSVWEYEVRLFDTEKGKSEPIIQTRFDPVGRTGEIINQARMKGGYIYVLSEIVEQDTQSKRVITRYSLDGKRFEHYPLPQDMVSDVSREPQPPIWMDFWGDYYLLSTIDQVAFLCKWEEGTFKILSIPTESTMLCRSNGQAKTNGRYGYLLEKNELYAESMLIFYKETATFYRYTFDIEDRYHDVVGLYEDENGDLALLCEAGEATVQQDAKLLFVEQQDVIEDAVLLGVMGL